MRKSMILLALIGANAALPAFASTTKKTFEIDSSHSSIGFSVRHLMSQVPGRFTDYSGTFVFNDQDPSKSTAKVTIVAKSINTDNEKRDGHLRSSDFFDVENHPTINFDLKKMSKVAPNKYKAHGDLNMRGVVKPVSMDVEWYGTANGMMGEMRAGFLGTGTLNRKDFGIVWNKALDAGGMVLGDEVKFTLNVEAVEKTGK